DGRVEGPASQRQVAAGGWRAVSAEQRAARQTGEALAPRFLVKPRAIGGHAEPRLGSEWRDERGKRERQDNWKGVIGAARLHRSEYGKEAWAAHPGRLARARRLGLPSRPGRPRRRARRHAHLAPSLGESAAHAARRVGARRGTPRRTDRQQR